MERDPTSWQWLSALIVGWVVWATVAVGYVGLFAFRISPYGILLCSASGSVTDSTHGSPVFSWWPFGPGCDFGGSVRRPSVAWVLVLIVVAVIGAALTKEQRRYVAASRAPRTRAR